MLSLIIIQGKQTLFLMDKFQLPQENRIADKHVFSIIFIGIHDDLQIVYQRLMVDQIGFFAAFLFLSVISSTFIKKVKKIQYFDV